MSFAGSTAGDLTGLLQAWNDGDSAALDGLTPIVYAELHRIASFQLMRERDGHPLQPTALINEVFVRLMDGATVEWANRTHFFAVFGRMMRQILIDFARAMQRTKRGAGSLHIVLAEAGEFATYESAPIDLLDLDAALEELASLNARQAQVVELRYFGGLENMEIASVLGISEPTVRREWRHARAWLFSRLSHCQTGGDASLAPGA